jgi:probable DNA repair protein
MGWPGERIPDTLEYQQVQAWQELVQQLASFDALFPSLALAETVALLESLAGDTQFQAQTRDSSVQILGLLEAAGMNFDYLWVAQLDKASWPQPTSPNPLLPVGLQKRLQMPLASPARELGLARKLTRRFASAAPQVVFSYSLMDGDKALGPSSLIEEYPLLSPDRLIAFRPANYWQVIHAAAGPEPLRDDSGPPLTAPKRVRGGSQILKDQAACPFRAFAIHRLGAVAPEQPGSGFSGLERGSLIHNALELIWKQLRSHAALVAMDEAQLDALIERSIQTSFRPLEAERDIGPRLKAIECARIQRLLGAWLALERQRPPFAVVLSETQRRLTLSGLPISLRYDRVDRLHDDRLLVLDYKTGRVDIKSWVGERPDEPQVPLYAIANQTAVSAVAFGQINSGEVSFKGLGEDPGAAPGLLSPEALVRHEMPPTWPALLDHWREALDRLAREFVAGFAAVAPKKPPATCQYCHLHSLCRVREQGTGPGNDAEASPGGEL